MSSDSAIDVNYGDYLQLHQLLSLQTPRSVPEHPDELLFIVVHQASELWFKVLLHEFDALVVSMEQHDVCQHYSRYDVSTHSW